MAAQSLRDLPIHATGEELLALARAFVGAPVELTDEPEAAGAVAVPLPGGGRAALRLLRAERGPDERERAGLELVARLLASAAGAVAAGDRFAGLSSLDPLTGLGVRAQFEDALSRESARMRRHGQLAAVVVVDVIELARANAAAGRPAGDALLVAAARAVRAAARSEDLVARVGDDEFAILQAPTSLEVVAAFPERLRALAAATPIEGYAELKLDLSIGIATGSDTQGDLVAVLSLARERRTIDRRRRGGGAP